MQRRSIIPVVIVCMLAFVVFISGLDEVDFIILLCVGTVLFVGWDEWRDRSRR
jgi:hypothetical protein